MLLTDIIGATVIQAELTPEWLVMKFSNGKSLRLVAENHSEIDEASLVPVTAATSVMINGKAR